MSTTRQIVCGHCGRINRLPPERTPQGARCGACHQPMFAGQPIEVDEAAFDRHVARSDIPVLIDVWAPWCGPCRAMAPMFERAAQALEPGVRLLKLNSDNAPALSSRLNISGIPTLLLMHGGREIARHSGAMDTRSIVAWTETKLTRS
ncbi:thioredoxin TrxC [Bradyrhizobium symbiodeficiens]|uniref:Thioredoxin TrxC n=1 Tax=Bradyrhizobium symbiodeficiens TaxID=1404367 RepID=A0A2U8QEB5_9BRAD|nr:thioredoxin TrxC [Bradyrhizobium symbiodeficiens]AWM08530.1 thioredoxin TrxC [Bradyrhizobium symbiodeficiens]QDF39095.1 thioredoxin TrxC [Bradyrhizobium symbiodeficiens]QIP01538.1 thioredoxin TrxC [Bradyrhizobium symbiodeficiens]QIP08818.1 thioredoxin TrxC [Bradyrhizobium symbiodeficiens]